MNRIVASGLTFVFASMFLILIQPSVAPTLNEILVSTSGIVNSGSQDTSLKPMVAFEASVVIYRYGWYPVYLPAGEYMVSVAEASFLVGFLCVGVSLLTSLSARLPGRGKTEGPSEKGKSKKAASTLPKWVDGLRPSPSRLLKAWAAYGIFSYLSYELLRLMGESDILIALAVLFFYVAELLFIVSVVYIVYIYLIAPRSRKKV
jgi:hypothetical protein